MRLRILLGLVALGILLGACNPTVIILGFPKQASTAVPATPTVMPTATLTMPAPTPTAEQATWTAIPGGYITRVTVDGVRLRAGPGIEFQQLATINTDDPVEVNSDSVTVLTRGPSFPTYQTWVSVSVNSTDVYEFGWVWVCLIQVRPVGSDDEC